MKQLFRSAHTYLYPGHLNRSYDHLTIAQAEPYDIDAVLLRLFVATGYLLVLFLLTALIQIMS